MISSADLNALILNRYQKEHLDLLFQLLRQPSVSTTGEGVEECARLVHQLMTEVGLQAELQPTGGWPVVYGEWIADASAPSVLIYGHYDVQPVGDLGLWTTPPFEPAIRDGRIYARGSAA
jgi:acetylornithine deacetylase/succinyl-diaminopimelate desuccinylase-like protein